jgi:CheY-like chemotaxis protein
MVSREGEVAIEVWDAATKCWKPGDPSLLARVPAWVMKRLGVPAQEGALRRPARKRARLTRGSRRAYGAIVGACRILVVDDDGDTREALRTLLETRGYQVDEAPDGEIALQLAATIDPDIVILDIGLPAPDGFEVAARLSRQDGRNPFIVGLSGWAREKDFARARHGGFDAYITKPAGIDELLRLIERVSSEPDRGHGGSTQSTA